MLTEDVNGVFLARLYEVSLNDAVQHTDFSSLFDQYRIMKVQFTFQLINNPYTTSQLNNPQANITNWFPKLWYIVDHDGGPTETISSIKERQGVKCRILQPNKTFKVSFKPMCRTLTYSTPTSTGFAPRNIKVDMSDTAIEHFGLQVVFDTNGIDPSDSVPFRIAVERKLYFKCYGVR
jgi:hypothetical protein